MGYESDTVVVNEPTSSWQRKQSGSLSTFSAGFSPTRWNPWPNAIKETMTKQLPRTDENAISLTGDTVFCPRYQLTMDLPCVFWALSWVQQIVVQGKQSVKKLNFMKKIDLFNRLTPPPPCFWAVFHFPKVYGPKLFCFVVYPALHIFWALALRVYFYASSQEFVLEIWPQYLWWIYITICSFHFLKHHLTTKKWLSFSFLPDLILTVHCK